MSLEIRSRTIAAAAALAALAGCAGCDHVPNDAVTDCSAQVVPGVASADILFVIDDSGSMTDKQQALADNLATFIDALLGSAITLDVRIGVTNTSVNDYGSSPRTSYGANAVPSGAPYPGPAGAPFPAGRLVAIEQDASGVGQFGHFKWGTAYDPAHLTSVWSEPRVLSGGADLARDFKANVHQGEWGSSQEQPLLAMRLALDAASSPSGANAGLLRGGSRLAVVILTDEDDCSDSSGGNAIYSDSNCHGRNVDDPAFDSLSEFVSYLDTTIGAASGEPPVVAVIAGFDTSTGAPTGCSGSLSAPTPPRRLGAFVDRLDAAHPGRTLERSICQPFGAALVQIASVIIPQTMPLEQAPADWRMLAVLVNRASGSSVGCRLAEAGTAAASTADAVFTPPQAGAQASISFQNACRLGVGDRVTLNIVCAR